MSTSGNPMTLYGSGAYGAQPIEFLPLGYYMNLLTSEYRNSPKLNALLTALLQKLMDVTMVQVQLDMAFDLDDAVGVQLDILGLIVGVSRQMRQEVVSAGQIYTTFPDSQYRVLLKVQIAQNVWDGTLPGVYNVWNTTLGSLGYGMILQDHQDMSIDYIFTNPPTDPILNAILTQGYFDLRPAGVKLNGYFTPSAPPGSPTFAFNMEVPPLYQGYNEGYWMVPLAWIINASGVVGSSTIVWTTPAATGFPVGTLLLISAPGITPPLTNYTHTVLSLTSTGFVTDNPSGQPSSEVISNAILQVHP
jgi:Protein of unknown function (DUF2612)